MTIQRRERDAQCWFVNGADRTVDVYVDHHDEAYAAVEPEEDQPVFSVDSDADGVYGTYTFEAREKDDPGGAVLASASVELDAGDCYTAAFHQVDDDAYRLSVYEGDFSPSGASRFEIHHVGYPERIDWTLAPKEGTDPRVPVDERSGTLERGQYQQAIEVTENDYRLEILVDGGVVAFRPDVELEAEKAIVAYVVGDPKPGMGPDEKQAHVFSQEYHVPSGPGRADETTAPAGPLSTTDDNRPIEFDVDPPDMYETNRYEVAVRATDPDGVVTGIGLDAVEPAAGGIRLLDDAVEASPGVGESATGTLDVSPNVSPGRYDARLVANPDGVGERATGTVTLDVEPVTADRLWERVEHYHGTGAVTDAVAGELLAQLGAAGASPDGVGGLVSDVLSLFESVGGSSPDTRGALERVLGVVDEERGSGIDEAAADDVATETRAMLEHLESE